MIGAIATMAGKDEAIVMLVSKPFGRPASASRAFAFAASARSPKNLASEWAQFHSGMTPPRIGVAWPKKPPATSALRSSARPIAWRTFGLSSGFAVLFGRSQ